MNLIKALPLMKEPFMKSLILGIFLLTSQLAFSQAEVETLSKTPIKEVKAWVKTVAPEETCADEYLKRRTHLGIYMGLSPVVIAGSTAVGLVGGTLMGTGLYAWAVASGAASGVGFADLITALTGGFLGGLSGLSASGVAEGFVFVNFFRTQNIIRLVYESRHEGGLAVEGFFSEFQGTYPDNTISKDQFVATVADLDSTGKLCDGSIVDPRRYKKGRKLKQRLANKKEIFSYIQGL